MQCVNITILEDEVFEGDETFMVVVEPEVSADTITSREETFTIRDNEG